VNRPTRSSIELPWRTNSARSHVEQLLSEELRFAQAQQRFSSDSEVITKGRQAEANAVVALDRLMTRARAIEGRLDLMRRGVPNPIG
jgi:hypothetical protein